MDSYAITYESMDSDSPMTRRIILRILQRVKSETNLDLTKGRLFIEAFPLERGGCVLYVNRIPLDLPELPEPVGFNTPLVYRFISVDDLCDACHSLFLYYNHLIFKSSLYREGQNYLLMVYSYYKMDRKISAIIGEYGQLIGKGQFAAVRADEYAKPLIADTAIETMMHYFYPE